MTTTPIGQNVITAFARRFILPEITDVVYGSNVIFFRLNKMNRRVVQGGTHIEVPFMYSKFSVGGPYQGYQTLTMAPQDTVKNGAFDWKQQYVPVVVDGLTLIKTDSPDAIVNFLRFQFAQAEMDMADNIGDGVMSDGTNAIQITGFEAAVDNGTVATTYGGYARASNTFLNSQVDTTSAVLTDSALLSWWGNCKSGGRALTLLASRTEQQNRYLNLRLVNQQQNLGAGGTDEVLAQAGFTNAIFMNTPWVDDDKVFDGPDTSNSAILGLNERYSWFVVSPRADFFLQDFQESEDKDAMTSKLLWAGELVNTNPSRQGKMTAIAA